MDAPPRMSGPRAHARVSADRSPRSCVPTGAATGHLASAAGAAHDRARDRNSTRVASAPHHREALQHAADLAVLVEELALHQARAALLRSGPRRETHPLARHRPSYVGAEI